MKPRTRTDSDRAAHQKRLESVVVATDLSANASRAVLWAAEVARRAGADLTPAIVFGEPSPETPAGDMIAHRQMVVRLLEAELEALGVAPGCEPPAAAFGDANVLLPRLARQLGADLVVLGSRGGGGFAGLRLGSVTNDLLHHTTVPLAVVPPVANVSAPGPLVVGVDGSEHSAAALDWALDAASDVGAEVAAVYVHDPLIGPARYAWLERSAPGAEERAARTLVADMADERGMAIDLTRLDAPTVDGLVTAAVNVDALALVVGAKHTDRLGGRVLSRVPSQLVRHSEHAVIVIRS